MPGRIGSSNHSEPLGPASQTSNENVPDDVVVETPVLIAGGGPVGLLFAHLLSRLGVKSLVIEKYPERLGAPKAHVLSPRSLDICRQFGLDTTALRNIGTPRADAYWVNFVTNLSGDNIGKLPFERLEPEALEHTPDIVSNVPQPRFEQFVAAHLSKDPQVELRASVAFVSCTQDANGVLSTVEERSTKNRYRIRSKYVVGCDGARSQVRQSLGIKSDGEDGYETMMTIHFNADLRPVLGDRVGMLHWITDPAASGFIIGYDLSDNQVLITNFDSDKHPVESWNEELCRKTVNAAIGKEVPFDVLSYRPWILNRKIAEHYNIGNVFLAGDAAHSFPPTGGLGLNCGIADVHNLAYKIAAVQQGWGGKTLLESYDAERRHVADIYSKQSVKNGKKIFSFLKAVGTGGIDDIDQARRNLYKTIRDPTKQEMIQNHVEEQREHFSNLELHIGYVYGSKETPPHASHYTPKFVAGARLPHAWISFRPGGSRSELQPLDVSYVHELDQKAVDARRFSTLDLCSPDSFTFLVGKSGEWTQRVSKLASTKPGSKLKLHIFGADDDFDYVEDYHRKLFNEGAGLENGGGLMVRPDQHILTCLTGDTSVEELETLLNKELGLKLGL